MTVLAWAAGILAALTVIAVAGLVWLNHAQGGRSVGSPDLSRGLLAGCPSSPNCVSTAADTSDYRHRIEPLRLRDDRASRDPASLITAIAAVLEDGEGLQVIERGETWLRATARSRVFRFVDDVDILVEPTTGLLHLRSASRVGEGDMGVNRARCSRIQAALQQKELI